MYNMQLWETSGHAANYKENMFVFEVWFFNKTISRMVIFLYVVVFSD